MHHNPLLDHVLLQEWYLVSPICLGVRIPRYLCVGRDYYYKYMNIFVMVQQMMKAWEKTSYATGVYIACYMRIPLSLLLLFTM